MPDSDYLRVEIPALSITGQDLILTDPDHPGTAVHWLGQHAHTTDGLRIFDYVTPDGTQGRHVFENPTQMVMVALRQRSLLGLIAQYRRAA